MCVVKLIVGIVIALNVIVLYACCVVAGRADDAIGR